MLTGILIIATKSAFYGRMAYELANSIKALEAAANVCLVADSAALAHLTPAQCEIFSQVLPAPDVPPFRLKLCAYDLSPFDRTLFLDADTIWLPKKTPAQLFAELAPLEFTGITEGFYDLDNGNEYAPTKYHYWCDPMEAKAAYKLTGRFYRWRTELLYFKKCATAKKLFALAQKIYDAPKIKPQMFAGGVVPDELAINIAACKIGVHPHVQQWQPVYWARIHKPKLLPQLMNEYYLYSAGGNWATGEMQKTYNTVAAAAHKKNGSQFIFTLASKKSSLKERAKI